jgi:integrase
MARKPTPGVLYRHSRDCADHETCDKTCNRDSEAPWEAWVFDSKYVDPATGRRGKKIRQRFGTHAAAKGWRADATSQVRRQKLRATDTVTARKTLDEEIAEWLEGARTGAIRNKREQPYKPAVVRNYELALRLRVRPALGDRRLADVTFADLLNLKEQLQATDCSASVIRNTFVPLAAIYRRARLQGRVVVDPTTDLPLPTAGSRDRAATPAQATALLEPLDDAERAAWATAFYAGLRRGELRALRVDDVDLDAGLITVKRSWDAVEGEIAPKSRAGIRQVFIIAALRPHLESLVTGRPPDGFVFGSDLAPFEPRAFVRKAERVWAAIDRAGAVLADVSPAPLVRFTLHEARHSFSTWLDHSGVSPDRADRYMGHSSGSVASRYRHLLAAQVADDARRLDEYLAGAASGKVVALAAAG